MSYLPCHNPQCKSYGKPHPNCHCYAGMAEGGKVERFCSEGRMHKKDCEYFAEGGEAKTQTNKETSTPSTEAPTWENTTQSNTEQPTWDNTTGPTDNEEPTWENTTGNYETPGQQVLTGLEGAAQGFAGPLATGAELGLSKLGVPGISAEDIKGRQEANPWIHGLSEAGGLGAGLLTPIGQGSLISKGIAKILPETLPILGKVGASALKGFLTNASLAGSDELSKAMISNDGDQSHPVASILASGALGSLFGGASKLLSQSNLALGSKALSAVSGFGARASGIPLEGGAEPSTQALSDLIDRGLFDKGAFKSGYQYYDKALKTATKAAASSVALGSGIPTFGLGAIPAYEIAQSLLKTPIQKAGGLVVPALTKALTEGQFSKLGQLANYASKVEQGNQLINNSIGALFKTGNRSLVNAAEQNGMMNDLDDYIKNGGIDSDIQDEIGNQNAPIENIHPGFAKGGEVQSIAPKKPGIFHDHPIQDIYPAQNMLLMAAKARMSNYLKGLRPQENTPKLAFDPEPDQTAQHKTYKKALKLAVNPLSIMEEAKNGTLDQEHLQHFNALYPELGNVLQQKLTQKISEAQLKGEKPDYQTRQSLSLLMGTPMSSELKPQNIMAAQSVFAQMQKGAPQQGPGQTKNKKNTSTLTKYSQAYLTGMQANSMRQQKV